MLRGQMPNEKFTGDYMKTTKARRLESPRGAHNATSIAILALVAVGLGWLLAGCVPSAVHPFYRAADVIRDPALLGVWKDKPNGKECWTFTSGEGLGYTLEVQSDDQHAVFVAFLFKLGNARFLDLYPAKSALEEKLQNNAYGVALVPAHLLVRVRGTDPALRMSCLGLDWLTKQVKGDPKALAHVLLPDGRVVLTGETEAIQAFVKLHLNDTEAWNDMYDDGLVKSEGKPTAK